MLGARLPAYLPACMYHLLACDTSNITSKTVEVVTMMCFIMLMLTTTAHLFCLQA